MTNILLVIIKNRNLLKFCSTFQGKLVLKIPWKNLYSSPVEAYVEKLYLLVVPNTAVKYDVDKEEKLAISTKKGQIERFEQVKKAEEDKDKPKADKTFAEKLTTQIINNVQIKINDIHIRYEDNTTTGNPFALGLTLSELSVHTTDENWVQSLVAATVTRIFKVAQLEGLAMYMNCNTAMFQYDHPEAFNRLFQDTIATKNSTPENYKYSKLVGRYSFPTDQQLSPLQFLGLLVRWRSFRWFQIQKQTTRRSLRQK
jgi:vacuolar protein sorting-associated protein 13A/C